MCRATLKLIHPSMWSTNVLEVRQSVVKIIEKIKKTKVFFLLNRLLTLIFMSLETCFLISDNKRSPKPLNSVEPPDRTMFWYNIFRKSMSDFCIANVSTSWIPSHSSPSRCGRKRTSGARNLAAPIWKKPHERFHIFHKLSDWEFNEFCNKYFQEFPNYISNMSSSQSKKAIPYVKI
jgi:hypothetical protein